jgi:hypothetical protein
MRFGNLGSAGWQLPWKPREMAAALSSSEIEVQNVKPRGWRMEKFWHPGDLAGMGIGVLRRGNLSSAGMAASQRAAAEVDTRRAVREQDQKCA